MKQSCDIQENFMSSYLHLNILFTNPRFKLQTLFIHPIVKEQVCLMFSNNCQYGLNFFLTNTFDRFLVLQISVGKKFKINSSYIQI